ncbi:MAG TPA: TolC family protein [Terriglobia bacterium]|nr:TolC family protein [Terriglobia bacterium]
MRAPFPKVIVSGLFLCLAIPVALGMPQAQTQASPPLPDQPASQEQPQQPQKGSKTPEATAFDYTTSRAFPNVVSPYRFPYVPGARTANSSRLQELIQASKLELSRDDAVALALENNLDISVARYNLPIAQTDLLRAKSGGATRGVAGAYQSSTLFSGSIGAGVSNSNGGGGNGGSLLGGGIPFSSPVGCCDPQANFLYGWSHDVTPLNFSLAAGVPIETTFSSVYTGSYGQGFLTGTSYQIGLQGFRESSNSPASNVQFNPFIQSGLFIGVNQHLLNGFGYRSNARFIRIAQNDQKFAESVFEQKVEDIVSQVLTLYYGLLYDRESVRVAQGGLANAQKLLSDNQEEVQIGSGAKLDVVQAQLDVAQRRQELLAAQNAYELDQQSLKADISKSFDSELASVQIDPTDQLPEPNPNDVPPLAQAIREAEQNRPDIQQAEINLRNQKVTIQAVRNALLPTLDVDAVYAPNGLAGTLGPALSTLFRARYPEYSYGLSLNIPIRNRQEQADAARALIEQRQQTIQLQQARNKAVWDVSKAVSAVVQARGDLAAARNVAGLAHQSLQGVQLKFKLGRATVTEVIQSQRDLDTAQVSEVKARSDYAKALIQFEQATGTVLTRNHVALADAKRGKVPRPPEIPGTRNQE